jgi:hypothetical protein
MSCPAYASISRQILWLNLENSLLRLQDGLDGQLMDGVASYMPLLLINFDICLVTVSRIGNRNVHLLWIILCVSILSAGRSKTEGTHDVCPCMIALS